MEARRAVKALLQSFRREGMSVQTSVVAVEVVRSGQILDILQNIGFPDIVYVESIRKTLEPIMNSRIKVGQLEK